MHKRAVLIVNRDSRSGTDNIETVVTRLKAAGIKLLQEKIDHPSQIDQAICRHRDNVDIVIIGGGDGSMNAAASALAHTQLPLGILPLGTANDLARTLNIPSDLEEAADIIAKGIVHRIDLGSVNERYFFNIANIGLGVQVKKNLSGDSKKRWGVFSYAHGFVKAFKSIRPFQATITCDGRRERHASIQIAVGNGRHYGGGMTIAEEARIDDEMLFLYSVKPLPLWELLKCAFAFRWGQFSQHHPVYLDQAKTIEINTGRRMAVTADGEQVSHTPATFRVHGKAIAVCVPASYVNERQEEIMLLRDNTQTMLNEIHALCIESADHYAISANKTHEADLSRLFTELAEQRKAMACDLATQIRLLDDQPRMPDPDRETMGEIFTDIKLFFTDQERNTLLNERENLEKKLGDVVEASLKLPLSESTQNLLNQILAHINAAKIRLANAHQSS